MSQLRSFLSGKKTYLIGALMVALGVLQNNDQMILDGLGFITLRLGINKMGNNL